MTMTVGELKAKLANVSDDTFVHLLVVDQDNDYMHYDDPVGVTIKDTNVYITSRNGSYVEDPMTLE